MKNKMNQVQNTEGRGPVNVPVFSKNREGDGHPVEAKKNIVADDYDKAPGVEASKIFQGARVSENSTSADIKPVEYIKNELNVEEEPIPEEEMMGQLDLTGEGVNINKELPEAPGSVSVNGSNIETAPEDEMADVEDLMAENLEALIKQQGSDAQEGVAQDIVGGVVENTVEDITEKPQESITIQKENQKIAFSKDTDGKLDKFMNTDRTAMPTEETTMPEKGANVLSNGLNIQVVEITAVKKDLTEIKKLLLEKEEEIQMVNNNIGVLGVENNAVTALVGELDEYKLKLANKESELQEQINKLQSSIRSTPEVLTELRNNVDAGAITEIKTLLDGMAKIAPITEVEIEDKLDSVVKIWPEKGVPGAITDAIRMIYPKLALEKISEMSDKAFKAFATGVLNELKTDVGNHEEAVAEFGAMLQSLALSSSRIKVEVGKDDELKVSVLKDQQEVVANGIRSEVADDYGEQLLAKQAV